MKLHPPDLRQVLPEYRTLSISERRRFRLRKDPSAGFNSNIMMRQSISSGRLLCGKRRRSLTSAKLVPANRNGGQIGSFFFFAKDLGREASVKGWISTHEITAFGEVVPSLAPST
jgi:hypothetical protein